jgi:TRAP transporter 4TM/12TM fusion protein
MKDSGYKPDVAAGIEAAASTGAGIMPPIMAMAAFALAAFVGIPYFKVMTMAIIPAILYFLCLGLFVQLFALKHNFKPLPAKLDTKVVIKTLPQFLIPVTVLLVLLMMGHSLAYTAFYTLVTLVIVSLLRKETRGSWRTWLEGATEGAILGGGLGVSCALIGIIISSVGITGLGIRLAGLIDILSGGSIWIALVLTALIVIILGCGLPPVASYLIVAMLGAPILIDMGIPLLPAHFFVFFFAVFAFITPPVGMSCVVAASVAGASYMKTAVQAMRVGIVGWFLPFLVILAPLVLMLPADLPLEIVKLIACLIIVLFLQVLLVGYYLTPLNFKERLMSAITAAALVGFVVVGNYFLLALGLIVGAYLSFNQWRKKRQLATTNSA